MVWPWIAADGLVVASFEISDSVFGSPISGCDLAFQRVWLISRGVCEAEGFPLHDVEIGAGSHLFGLVSLDFDSKVQWSWIHSQFSVCVFRFQCSVAEFEVVVNIKKGRAEQTPHPPPHRRPIP